MSWPWLVLLVLAAVLAVAVEKPRLDKRFGVTARRDRDRQRRKKQLRVVTPDDESEEFIRSVQRDLDSRGVFRAQLGLVLSLYGAVDLGVEAHLRPRSRVSPFFGAGLGLMGEEDYGRSFFRGTAGLQVMLSRSVVLRGALQAGTHDGQAGPHLATLAIGWRF